MLGLNDKSQHQAKYHKFQQPLWPRMEMRNVTWPGKYLDIIVISHSLGLGSFLQLSSHVVLGKPTSASLLWAISLKMPPIVCYYLP